MVFGWSAARPVRKAVWTGVADGLRHRARRTRQLFARLALGKPLPVSGPAPCAAPADPAKRPVRLDQWQKLIAILMAAIEGRERVRDRQAAATRQLDLAQYGILTLVEELTAVMALPGRAVRPATVHALAASAESASRRAAARALAA